MYDVFNLINHLFIVATNIALSVVMTKFDKRVNVEISSI